MARILTGDQALECDPCPDCFLRPSEIVLGSTKFWSVYIIEADDGALYTGISTDVARRFTEHANGSGAKFFHIHKPRRIVYAETGLNRAEASRRERAIKQLSRSRKLDLIQAASAHPEELCPTESD